MIKIDNINFQGNIRYMGANIYSLDYAPLYEIGKDKISKELIEFANHSAFINKLKEDKDVFIHHHQEIFKNNKEPEPQKKGFFAKLFSTKKAEKPSPANTGKDHLSIIFENKKADNIKDTELCEINITLPINKNKQKNFDRFESILDNYSSIEDLRKEADKLFPDNSHKVTLLPYNKTLGWCEFWTGEKTALDTLKRLDIAILSEYKDSAKKMLKDID